MVNLARRVLKKVLPVVPLAIMTYYSLFPFAKKADSIISSTNEKGAVEFFDDGQKSYKTDGINEESIGFFNLLKKKIKASKENKKKLEQYINGGGFYSAVRNYPGTTFDWKKGYLTLTLPGPNGQAFSYKGFKLKKLGLKKWKGDEFIEETSYEEPTEEGLSIDEADALLEKDEAEEVKEETKKEKRKSKVKQIIKEAKQKKAKEPKKDYITASEEKQKEFESQLSYYLAGKTGFEEVYKYGNPLLFKNIKKGTPRSEVIAGLRPSTKIFKLSKNEEILDYLDMGKWVAGHVAYDNNGKVESTKLLFKKDLDNITHNYARSKKRIGESIDDVIGNYRQLRSKNVRVVKDLKSGKDEVTFFKIYSQQGVDGVANVSEESKVTENIDLDKESYKRVSQPKIGITLAQGSGYSSLEGLLSGDGRTAGVRGKANVIHDAGMMKKAQLVVSLADKNNRKLIFGGSLFADKIGNYSYDESDAFLKLDLNNLKINFLTGMTNDEQIYEDTQVGNFTLKQRREGKSNPLINLGAAYTLPGQIPFLRAKPTLEARIANVSGEDITYWAYEDANGNVLTSGSIPTSSEYSHLSANIRNRFNLDILGQSRLELIVGGESNNFRQQNVDNINTQTRIGFIGEHNKLKFNISGIFFYQINKDAEGKEKNTIASGAQVAFNPSYDTAVILGGNYEGLNGSKEISFDFIYDPWAREHFNNKSKFITEKNEYSTFNAPVLVPVNPIKSYIPLVSEGIHFSFSAGNDKYEQDLCNAALDFYVGKGFSVGAKYIKKGDDTKSLLTIQKSFR